MIIQVEDKVSVKNLVAFDLSSHLLSYELSLSNPSSLVNVSIDVSSMDCQLGRKFLRGICGVKDLILTDISFMAFSWANLTAMLKFSSLKHLTLYLETVYFTVENLTELLCNMPNIQSLLFINAHRFAFGKHGWTLGTTSQPILSNRKSVKFDEFYGVEKELSVVEVLFEESRRPWRK
ncbi:hypothetical protein IFM89_025880 [Coptis chinensis]|uniref:Uncharacterized protein n=1 Tax=Coptis chinensis TaxID=261450 RepID=A0A835LEL5_9MAGN|nr:hypothetical protein IFM89_025880 [Coptis chinensis]